jgi:hypothetical protein
MLWQKAWIDTRWRFLAALAVMLVSAFANIRLYALAADQMRTMAAMIAARPELGQGLIAPGDVAMRYHDFLWSFWFTLGVQWTICAALIGSGGVVSQQAGGGVLFTLSLPVTRGRLLFSRTAVGLIELTALAVIPSLAIPLASPLIHQSFPLDKALLMACSTFVGGLGVFGFAVWLSTAFADRRVWLVAIVAPLIVGNLVTEDSAARTPFRLIDTWTQLDRGQAPWLLWLASVLAFAAFLFAATRSLARRDF